MRNFILVILLSMVTLTEQHCCSPDGLNCCETGPCNIFCCNCNGKCSQACLKRRGKRSINEDIQAQLRFISIDTNGDGLITEDEGRDFMLNGTSSDRAKRAIGREWFTEIDTNGDEFIQPGEFDYSLV